MTSKKQAAANKKNAKLSTGPKTVAGKKISAMNAVKHGLFMQPALTMSEDGQTLLAYQKALSEQFKPVGTMERQIIRDMVMIRMRIDRLANFERSIGDSELIKPTLVKLHRLSDPYEQTKLIDEVAQEDKGFYIDIDSQIKIGRYQTMLDNQLKKKYEFLLELQKRPFEERDDSKPESHWEDPIFESMQIYQDRRDAIAWGSDPNAAELYHVDMRRELMRKKIRFDLPPEDPEPSLPNCED